VKVSIPKGLMHGWGIAGTHLAAEVARLPAVDGVTLHGLGQDFRAFDPGAWDRINIGYCFFEYERLLYPYIAAAAERWHHIVAGSRWCEGHLQRAGMPRTRTILQGIDSARFFARPPRHEDGRFIVFSGGKFEFRKGQDIVIAALRVFMERHPDVWFSCAWHNPWPFSLRTMEQTRLIDFRWREASCEELLRETLERSGIDLARVLLHPALDNGRMPRVYAESDIGVFPNRCEGGNNLVMCEYMACGRTVIASDRTGHADVITSDNAYRLSSYQPVTAWLDGREGGNWLEASPEELLDLLERVYADRAASETKAKAAAHDMARLSWREAALRFHRIAVELAGRGNVGAVREETPRTGAKPQDPLIQDALRHHRAGLVFQAEPMYRRALERDPDNADAAHLLGILLSQRGRHLEGLALIDRALTRMSGLGAVWYHRGLVLAEMGRSQEALDNLRHAVGIEPSVALIHLRLGQTAQTLGLHDEALAGYRRAHQLDPTAIEPLLALGTLLTELGRLAEALDCFRRLQTLDAGQRAILPHLTATLGKGLGRLGRSDMAVDFRPPAPSMPPEQLGRWNNLATVFVGLGHTDEARAVCSRAFELSGDPALLLKGITLLPPIPRSIEEIAGIRQALLNGVRRFVEADHGIADPLGPVTGHPLFYLAYHGLDDRPIQEAVADAYRRSCPSLSFTAEHCLNGAPASPRADGRLRVGFLSEHLFSHTIGLVNQGLIARLPRERFHVTVIATPRPADPVREDILASADAVIELPPRDLDGARRRIAAAELDLLYYTDLGMAPLSWFLAFARLAPVQVVAWGHPDTTGLATIDHFLSCTAMEPPDADAHYTESLVRLPGPTLWYPRLLNTPKDRAALRLPEDRTLYLCPQSPFKIHPDFDAVLVEILRRDPRGLVVFVATSQPQFWSCLLRRLRAAGPDVADRIITVPCLSRTDFVALMACCDVMLDPLHFSGGNTSLEAFSQGVPIVTWPGRFMRGRHTFGWYRLMEVDDLIAHDPAHYVELAVEWGRDPERRRELRGRILEAGDALFERDDTVAAVSDFLEQAILAKTGG
jgi:protein O-GlcNAc transferase